MTDHIIPGEHTYEGVRYMQVNPVHVLDAVKTLELRDDDVIVASYPKTGSLWMGEVVWQLRCVDRDEDPDAIEGASKRDGVSIEFDSGKDWNSTDEVIGCSLCMGEVCWKKSLKRGEKPDDKNVPKQEPAYIFERLKNMESPRTLATHLQSYFLESEVRRTKARVIVMERNPKDSLVSYYYMYSANGSLGKFAGTFRQFMEIVKRRGLVYGDIFNYYKGWWSLAQEQSNMLCVSYEDMKQDPLEVVRKVADFIHVKVDDNQLEDIVFKTSFQSMSDNPQLKHGKDSGTTETNHYRKGVVGAWKQYFNNEDSTWVDNEVKKVLGPLGTKFQYEL